MIKPVFIVLYKRETVTGYLELPSVSWKQNGGHSKLLKPQCAVLDVSLSTFDRNICTSLIQ